MSKPVRRILFWTPRVLGILFVLFLSLFAFDVFDMQLGFWDTLLALFMHLIPSIILAIAVALAWRWEWVGVVIFIGWAVFYVLRFNGFDWYAYAMVAGIPVVIALLFLAGWIWRKQIRNG